MVAQHYRWDFYGLSTDTKPDATNEKVANGSTYYEANTSKLYVWYNERWYEKTGGSYELPVASAETLGGVKVGDGLSITEAGVLSASGGGGGGGFTTLTSDNYNYPENNPNSVGLWLLDAGTYYVDNSSSLDTRVRVYSSDNGMYYNCSYFEVIPLPQSSYILINVYGNFSSGDGDGYYGFRQYKVDQSGNGVGHVVYATTDDLSSVAPTMLNSGSYNFPNNSPDGIALWNLNPGKYKLDAELNDTLKVYFSDSTSMDLAEASFEIKDLKSGTEKLVKFDYTYESNNDAYCESGWTTINTSNGNSINMYLYTQEAV